jgi:hypothetical protein
VQMKDGCDKLERLLENMINVMFAKWEYPLWEGISATGKIAKYNLWYLLMMSGQVKFDKTQITFITSNEDIGFENVDSDVPIPTADENKAFRAFLDSAMIDQTL